MNIVLGVLAATGLLTLYALATEAVWRWTGRWPRPAPPAIRAFVALIGGLYAPVWVPVWAVGRWVRGPKPQRREDILAQVVLVRDPADVERSVVISEDLPPLRTMTPAESEVMARWWDEVMARWREEYTNREQMIDDAHEKARRADEQSSQRDWTNIPAERFGFPARPLRSPDEFR